MTKKIEFTEEDLVVIRYALNYLKSNLSDEVFCSGGMDEATEEELIKEEKKIDNILTMV